MAVAKVHLAQAKHNEDVADLLVGADSTHDWAITAAYYAAIHYVECWLYDFMKAEDKKHTETSMPLRENKEPKHSMHNWRQIIVENNLAEDTARSLRKLKVTSDQARYLVVTRKGPGGKPIWICMTADEFFKPEHARNIVNECLHLIKQGTGFK
jgi:hypothetical protein